MLPHPDLHPGPADPDLYRYPFQAKVKLNFNFPSKISKALCRGCLFFTVQQKITIPGKLHSGKLQE
jgi:hypothetical protein